MSFGFRKSSSLQNRLAIFIDYSIIAFSSSTAHAITFVVENCKFIPLLFFEHGQTNFLNNPLFSRSVFLGKINNLPKLVSYVPCSVLGIIVCRNFYCKLFAFPPSYCSGSFLVVIYNNDFCIAIFEPLEKNSNIISIIEIPYHVRFSWNQRCNFCGLTIFLWPALLLTNDYQLSFVFQSIPVDAPCVVEADIKVFSFGNLFQSKHHKCFVFPLILGNTIQRERAPAFPVKWIDAFCFVIVPSQLIALLWIVTHSYVSSPWIPPHKSYSIPTVALKNFATVT